jgi:prepilin signal peptidase PulO-like enzyme (type II secretory pathway)
VKLRHVEIPFGPFLAAAALAYLFLEPWLRIRFWLLYH